MNTKEFINKIHDLSVKEIAEQIRLDLKEAYPEFKFSVISERNSIDLYIMSWPIEFYSSEYKEAVKNNDYEELRIINRLDKVFTTNGWKIYNDIERILNQYNHNNSDSQSDYFDVNYYKYLDIWKWNKPYVIV